MKHREITIKVQNNGIYLNPRIFLPIQQTNIPFKHLTFQSYKEIYWQVEMLEYKSADKCLKVVVTDYCASSIINFDKQEPKYSVENLLFEKFDWKKLEPILSIYQKSQLSDLIFNADCEYDTSERRNSRVFMKPVSDLTNINPFTDIQNLESKPTVRVIAEEFWVDFSKAVFMSGVIAFKMLVKSIGKEIEFQIPNAHILAEFENIKFWFAKKLKTKKFKVNALITVTNNKVTEAIATSKQIDQITPELIDSVKYQRTSALSKVLSAGNNNKSLFTTEELFTIIESNAVESNVFNQTEEEILTFFVENGEIRNKKQLAFLASNKQCEKFKLRYTLNPHFGFLFLVEGEENNHFIWELLNSHGTYIWSFGKSKQNIEEQYKRIENVINIVRTIGRESYKRAYNNNQADNDLFFRVISHDGIGSNSVDNFPKWKSKLEEQLK